MNRIARIAGPAVLLLVGFVALLTALVIGGGANPALIADPGPVVRFRAADRPARRRPVRGHHDRRARAGDHRAVAFRTRVEPCDRRRGRGEWHLDGRVGRRHVLHVPQRRRFAHQHRRAVRAVDGGLPHRHRAQVGLARDRPRRRGRHGALLRSPFCGAWSP
ncbi:hypothetical protein Q9Q99_15190 [Curtobacterium flaccumfaciens]|nr:hypothetical protein Q9Q99_15190 [Curtobacterium flaccumfaciens]